MRVEALNGSFPAKHSTVILEHWLKETGFAVALFMSRQVLYTIYEV